MNTKNYASRYSNSRALIVGINKYSSASNLQYAVEDAEAVGEILKSRFGFPKNNIKILINKNATLSKIRASYMAFANSDIDNDDRILFFFAGHGYTQTGRQRQIGFLVPYDGNVNDLSSLIGWDYLTGNAELIPAKHILFVMDACYGGLAVTRNLQPGSMRFLKDMLQRYSRQVLTAGKADEVVSDSGGPIPNHSVFTGHLIQGLEGKAATTEGVITANGIMSYVYEKVANDPYSRQTPHYGFFDGDGDFIFNESILSKFPDEDHKNKDVLISVPYIPLKPSSLGKFDLIETVKEYLSDSKYIIKLDDLVNSKLRETVSLLNDHKFSLVGKGRVENISKQLKFYEDKIKDIQLIISCIAHWGDRKHYQIINKILARNSDNLNTKGGGYVVDICFRWYPILLLLYSAGIASIASGNFLALSSVLKAKVQSHTNIYGTVPIPLPVGKAIKEILPLIKELPGHERHYVPLSEYLFKLLQPDLEDLIFLGNDYERYFDYLEIFLALTYADLKYKTEGSIWGPLGRFAWKYRNRNKEGNTFLEILEEAERQKDDWPPLKVKLFSGSYERFIKLAKRFQKELLNELNWF